MITLSLLKGQVFVWNADDWLQLREELRIVGSLIGCIASLPRQDSFHGLPALLLPEETTLLLEKGLIKLVSYKDVTNDVAIKVKEKYGDYKEKIKQEQIKYYEEERKKQVVSMIDRIIEGKRRKLVSSMAKNNDGSALDQNPTIEIDKEGILKSELEKVGSIPMLNTYVQTFTSEVWNSEVVVGEVEWTFPNNDEEKLRYMTFKDLWEKGYYLTSGQKFGGDFLVYPGDPVKFHAQFIVVCMDEVTDLTASDIVTYGRLGSSTRKTLVIASLSADNTIIYQSLSWAEVN